MTADGAVLVPKSSGTLDIQLEWEKNCHVCGREFEHRDAFIVHMEEHKRNGLLMYMDLMKPKSPYPSQACLYYCDIVLLKDAECQYLGVWSVLLKLFAHGIYFNIVISVIYLTISIHLFCNDNFVSIFEDWYVCH